MRVKNIQQFDKFDSAKDKLVWPQNTVQSVDLHYKTVGPCAFYVQATDVVKAPRYLLACVEGNGNLEFAFPAPFQVTCEPSGEVWVRRDYTLAAKEAEDGATYTRFSNMSLEMDPISVALHRQGILQRIANERENVGRDAYASQLERKLSELQEQVAALKPKEPPVDDKPAE